MEQVQKEQIGNFGKILLFIITVVSILIMFTIYFYLEDWRAENFPESADEPEDVLSSGMLACIEMGCPAGTRFIGSAEGSVYHDCSSTLARSIKEDNRVCFSSANEAISNGYRT